MDLRVARLLARTRVVIHSDPLVLVNLPPWERGRLQRRADRFHSPFCLTFAPQEVSLVCREVEWDQVGKGLRTRAVQRGYRMITLDAELDLPEAGYLRVVTDRLAQAGIPVCVVSTFHRDHLLVQEEDVARAQQVLEELLRECAARSAAEVPGGETR
ncbi:MAG: hypothetical protein C4304_02015 [candidate division GAL15 bacterium]